MEKNSTVYGLPAVVPEHCKTQTVRSGRAGLFLKIMRITAIQLTVAMIFSGMAIAHTNHAQEILNRPVSLTLKDVTLEKALAEIEAEAKVKFGYSPNKLKLTEKVSIEASSKKLGEVLEALFTPRSIKYTVQEGEDYIILTEKNDSNTSIPVNDPLIVQLPTIVITGKVMDSLGMALAGVNVIIKGTTTGTMTDRNGNYSIEATDNDVLVFSFIGYRTQETPVNNQTFINIILIEDITTLSEVAVVSTGYEKIPLERVTGSFGVVNNEKLNRLTGTDILSRLDGTTTGILFDRRSFQSNQSSIPVNSIVIRGLSTLTETMKSPLVILNNFPYDQDVSNINPNDVETITVLKDAAAASIWGSRAANGVIVITTKQGKFNQPMQLSFNGNITIGESPDLFAYPAMKTEDFIENEIFLFKNGYGPYIFNLNDPLGQALSPVVEILGQREAGLISSQDSSVLMGQLSNHDVRNDFEKYIYRQSIAKQYALNLTGGGNTIKYLFSVGYDKNLYNLVGKDYQRISFNTNIALKPLEKLDFVIGAFYTNSNASANSLGDFGSTAYDYREGVKLYPYAQLADANGNPLVTPKDYRSVYADTAGGGKLLDWKYKILEERRNIKNVNKSNDLLFNLSSNYKVTSYLSVIGSYQGGITNAETYSLKNQNSYYARDLINLYTEILPDAVINNIPKGGILDQSFSTLQSHTGRLQVNLDKSWSDKHQIVSIIGGEIRQKKESINGYRVYGYNNDNLSTTLVDYTTQFSFYDGRGSSQIPPLSVLNKYTDRFVSIFGNASYTYLSKYILSLSVREDAANLFGTNINDKWKPFWTVGLAWDISDEDFLKSKQLNLLKLRTSYGYLGNVNNSLAPYTIIEYSPAIYNQANQPFASITVPANPGLSWETSMQLNAGVDFGLFNSRISGSIDGYHKASDNVILIAEIDPTTGVSGVNKNSASMKTNGLEVAINTLNLSFKKFKWNTEFGFSYTATKVTDYLINESNTTLGGIVNGGGANGLFINPLKGKSPYSIISYRFAGLDPATGNPQGYLGETVSNDYRAIFNQLYDTANYVYHGSSLPTYYGFINNRISYHGFSLTVGVNYKMGYYFRKSTINYYRLFTQGITNADFEKRWQEPGDEEFTTVPSRVYPTNNPRRDDFYANSTANVFKGDHVRLQYIRLGYDLDKALAKKISVRNVQVYIVANNLGILWRANDKKLDPDFDSRSSRFPPPKTFTVGMRIDL